MRVSMGKQEVNPEEADKGIAAEENPEHPTVLVGVFVEDHLDQGYRRWNIAYCYC